MADTYDWVYNQKWLERFFEALRRESSWINVTTIGEVSKNTRSHGRVYIPTASYREMMEWALPNESGVHFENVLQDIRNSGKEGYYAPFIRGGFWRNFLEKYPESNNMHKKMLRVSNKVAGLTNGSNKPITPDYIGRSVARKGEGLPPNIRGIFRVMARTGKLPVLAWDIRRAILGTSEDGCLQASHKLRTYSR